MTIEGDAHFACQDTGEYRRGEAIAKEGWMKTK